jgi:hypothetical protein
MNNLPEKKIYICLPGQDAKGIVAGCANRVILRKHRDVVFDINLKKGNTYTLSAVKSDFYNERDKVLVEASKNQRATFKDGERFSIWVSRNFRTSLVLELNGVVIGKYAPNKLDDTKYDDDPKIKPEPMLIAIGSKDASLVKMQCTADDPYGMGQINKQEIDFFSKYLADKSMKQSQFDYASFQPQKIQVQEHVIVGELTAKELHPAILARLNAGGLISGAPDEVLAKEPAINSDFYFIVKNTVGAADSLMGNDVTTANYFKESAGYFISHWKKFNTLGMKMYIEKSPIGNYRYVLKGKLISLSGLSNKVQTMKFPIGSAKAEYLGANNTIRGRNGFGGFKRISLTVVNNFKAGMKVGAVGTVIDLYGDMVTVFGKNGSKDTTEFLGRAGVSIVKAGATAALGGVIAGVISAALVSVAGIPVVITVGLVIGGYILAATIIDLIDSSVDGKETIAKLAR